MSLRSCVYKDCQNHSVDGISFGKFTLFKFPSDPNRRKKWMELGKVPTIIPLKSLLMCSAHFDNKYFSINQRRTILVGEAEPYAYDESTTNDDVLNKTTNSNVEVEETEEEDFSELTLNTVTIPEMLEDVDEEICTEVIESISDDQKSTSNLKEDYPNKRRKVITIVKKINGENRTKSQIFKVKKEISTEKIIALPKETELPLEQENNSADDFEEDESNITTFIFKGEEYVQMPKKYYIQEKTTLQRKLETYANKLREIKSCLEDID